MPQPTFLIIGAAKSGTTALYAYLKQHPQVYMSSLKEPRFFALEGAPIDFRGPGDAGTVNKDSINDWDDYLALFSNTSDEKAIGEASPLYLYDPRAPINIRSHLPEVKLIAILRDPVERAYSAYKMHVMDGRETMTFEQALRDEQRRIDENWIWGHYVSVGRYAIQLERYLDVFNRDQVRVYLYDDLVSRPAAVLEDVFRFVEVDSHFTPDLSERHNISGVPKNRLLNRLLTKRYGTSGRLRSAIKHAIPPNIQRSLKILRTNNLSSQPLPPELRRRLIPLFHDDILRVQDIIGRDLRKWLM